MTFATSKSRSNEQYRQQQASERANRVAEVEAQEALAAAKGPELPTLKPLDFANMSGTAVRKRKAQTILTSGLGDTTITAPEKKTLLGQ